MKFSELWQKAEEFLNSDDRDRKEKKKCLKHLMKKLRKREEELEEKFQEGKGNREKVSKELAMVHAQRKKGLALLKQIKQENKEAKAKKEELKRHHKHHSFIFW